MIEERPIPKSLLPKPEGLEDQSGLDGNRQETLAKAVLPAACPSQAQVFEETVKLCPHQAPVQKAPFGSTRKGKRKYRQKNFRGLGRQGRKRRQRNKLSA